MDGNGSWMDMMDTMMDTMMDIYACTYRGWIWRWMSGLRSDWWMGCDG